MSDFAEIFKECIKSKNTKDFEKNLEQLYLASETQNIIKSFCSRYCDYDIDEYYVKEFIKEQIAEHNYRSVPKIKYFIRDINEKIQINNNITPEERKERINKEKEYKQNLCNYFILKYANQDMNDKYSEAGKNKGIQIINRIFDILDKEKIDGKTFLKSLIQKGGLESKSRQSTGHEIKTLYKTTPKIMRALVNKLVSFSVYTKLIEYIMENPKLNIPNLILDFNKVRDYLSILLNDNPRTKEKFIEKCNWKKVSSYEKEIYRISSLFGIERGKFLESKKELERFKHNDFAKIYDIHTVSNLAANFMILDILQKKKKETTKFQLKEIMNELSSQIKSEFEIRIEQKKRIKNHKRQIENIDPIMRFKKYTLLQRIKEMEEYGFISVDKDRKDRYDLKVKFLNDEQKNALKYVVPFFCGIYPFASIGHFLANRLDIDDKFVIKPFNVSNILDDCITYNLLEAINSKTPVKLVIKGQAKIKEFLPEEIFIENKTDLLKVKGNKQEYYLHDIAGFAKDKSSDEQNTGKNYHIESPVFSEIYSFYYKVFEDSIREYKKQENNSKKNINDITNYIPEKYKRTYNRMLSKNIFYELLPILAKLENYTVPLTTLELRWLKTIMQDAKFDLFVTTEEKTCLESLVNDIEPFNMSSFKIYDYKAKAYKNINNSSLPKIIDKDAFKKELKELNTFLFSMQNNTLSKTHNLDAELIL